MSQSAISRVELGRVGRVPFNKLRALGEALGADVELHVRWQGEGLDRLLDEAHATIVNAAVRRLRAAGWEVQVEATFAIGGERGSIDVLGWHPESGYIALCEVKSVVPDVQATLLALDRKVRLAPAIAADRGWSCHGVARILFVGESRTSRRRVERHAIVFRTAFPLRGRAVAEWLRRPALPAIAGVAFLTPIEPAKPSAIRGVGLRQAGGGRVRVVTSRCKRGGRPADMARGPPFIHPMGIRRLCCAQHSWDG